MTSPRNVLSGAALCFLILEVAVPGWAGVVVKAVCRSSPTVLLGFDLAEKGVDIATVTAITWEVSQPSGNTTLAVQSGSYLVIAPNYTDRVRRDSNSTANLILSQPTTADEGVYFCYVSHGAPRVATLRDLKLEILDGAKPSPVSLKLTCNENTRTITCDGPTDLGDTFLLLNRTGASSPVVNSSATALTKTFDSREEMTGTYTCSLTGGGAVCSKFTPDKCSVEKPRRSASSSAPSSLGSDKNTGSAVAFAAVSLGLVVFLWEQQGLPRIPMYKFSIDASHRMYN